MPIPTPAGVPVAMIVPALSIIPRDNSAMISDIVVIKVTGRAVLTQLPINRAANAQRRRIGNLIGGHNARSHRSVPVK